MKQLAVVQQLGDTELQSDASTVLVGTSGVYLLVGNGGSTSQWAHGWFYLDGASRFCSYYYGSTSSGIGGVCLFTHCIAMFAGFSHAGAHHLNVGETVQLEIYNVT